MVNRYIENERRNETMSDLTVTKKIETITLHTAVVGSGAAGLNAAHRLSQYGVENIALITESMNAGTSRNTGSDKQTYYKLSLAGGQNDSVRRLAEVLYDGGCVDGEHALCEASLSCQGFFKLVELGVPFPHDRYGEFVGYKTDHDPNDRGTSVGPYTSRYMTEALEQAVRERQIPIYDHHQVIQILTCDETLYGILCLNTENGNYVLFQCTNLVYATGGPAGIYADSVYPVSQFGASGLAFEAGVLGKNLTEWQYGLASLRPRWNVSGSYMQVLPRLVSTDQDGNDEREFLMEFYDTREMMMDMVFLKGYQWPFDARKVSGGSSMIDLLVYRETCIRGRRVWLDYRTNPGNQAIDFDLLSEETRGYLEKSGACQQTPYERLCHMNMPAVAFYQEHGVDLEKEMLEVAVCAQHNNGGLSVDAWWQTNIKGLFAVGEAAGTHGIYRPGGSALNAGQVGSTRAAEYIAAHKTETRSWTDEVKEQMAQAAIRRIAMGEQMAKELSYADAWKNATQKMSRCGAMMRDRDGIREMKAEIEKELGEMRTDFRTDPQTDFRTDFQTEDRPESGSAPKTAALSRFYRYYDMRLCQSVYLAAMMDYQDQGGKSRGSAVYRESPRGGSQISVPELVTFSLDGPDGRDHQDLVQELKFDQKAGTYTAFWRKRHKLEDIPESGAFEVVWKAYREKKIY